MNNKFKFIFGPFLLVLMLLFLSFNPIIALDNVEITYLKIDVEIMEDHSLKESVDILVNPKSDTDFDLHLPKGYTNLEVLYNNQILESAPNGIICLIPNELNSIKISYTLPEAIEIKNKDYVYMKELVYSNVKNLIFRIKLPQAYGIDSDDVSTIIPEPSYLQSDGKRIIVLWEMKSPNTPTIFKIKYNSLVNNSGLGSNFIIPLGTVLILIIAIGLFTYFRQFNSKEIEIKIPSSLLSEDEMAICDIIKNEGGKIKQKKLSNMTGFSKAKITKILTNLEKKELIEREPVGRTFIITLKKKIDH